MTHPDIASKTPDGMPIYRDDRSRSIVDSLKENSQSTDWYPGNAMALKLWHCVEALRDIETVLGPARAQKNSTKRKRHLKMFSVQLFSFASAVAQLCDQIISDEDARRWLEPGTTSEIATIKNEFLALVPIDWKGDLAVLRNKLGGHIDKKLWPWEASEIISRASLSNLGKWLHICLHVLLDLTKLDVYSWSCHSNADGRIRLMTNEPFLLTFEVDGEGPKKVVAFHMIQRSPRETLTEIVGQVVKNSQWMFQSNETRIRSLKIDRGGKWNTFTKGETIWFRDPNATSNSEPL